MIWGRDDLVAVDDDVLCKCTEINCPYPADYREAMDEHFNVDMCVRGLKAHLDSGASGCFSQPRIGRRNTRLSNRGSFLSADAMTTPRHSCINRHGSGMN